jgi:hypothetical protein
VPYNHTLFVAPELIIHYINAHHYRPPEIFCEAVLGCAPMRSQDYRRALAACPASKRLLSAGQ